MGGGGVMDSFSVDLSFGGQTGPTVRGRLWQKNANGETRSDLVFPGPVSSSMPDCGWQSQCETVKNAFIDLLSCTEVLNDNDTQSWALSRHRDGALLC